MISVWRGLLFREGEPWANDGALERDAAPSTVNNFQARYAIRHAWEGAIACDEPNRGLWGGPPEGVRERGAVAAGGLAFGGAGAGNVTLTSTLAGGLDALRGSAAAGEGGAAQVQPEPDPATAQTAPPATATTEADDGCGCSTARSTPVSAALVASALMLLLWRTRRGETA